MNPDVSRSLATFIAANNLGRESARELAGQFADVNQAEDLPEWVRELDDEFDEGELEDDDLGDEPELDQAARSAVLQVDFDDIDELERAVGNQFKQYWVYGKGRAKWNTWTELYHHLIKHVGRLRARRIASQWFHSRFGFWPGDDKNRVRQGKPPRGDRIGPG